MLVFCEECGASNDVDPKALEDIKNLVRCSTCGDLLDKSKIALARQAAAKTTSPPPGPNQPVDLKEVVAEILRQYPN